MPTKKLVTRWQKRPVIIEAAQLNNENVDDILAWIDANGGEAWVRRLGGVIVGISIQTLEGVMDALMLDWIIRGVQGEFYPCKPDIFSATYESTYRGPG